jgi:MFS family permease
MATAAALLGFSLSGSRLPSLSLLCSCRWGWARAPWTPGLNEYVAEHYASRHMNWLHCFWGLGAMLGPLLLSFYLSAGKTWRSAYLTISVIQFVARGSTVYLSAHVERAQKAGS